MDAISAVGSNGSTASLSTPRFDNLASSQGEFAAILARGRHRATGTAGEQRAAAREGAEEFVAITMVQPLLKQLRESNNAAAPFAPSSAEKQFRGMMDAQISHRIVKASNFPLVDVVARGLERGSNGSGMTNEGAARE